MNSVLADALRRRIGLALGAALLVPKIVQSGDSDTAAPSEVCFDRVGSEGSCLPLAYVEDEIYQQLGRTCSAGEGSFSDGQCCYPVDCADTTLNDCGCYGRPYVDGARVVRADVSSDGQWQGHAASPDVAGLSAEARERLARFWLDNALSEHSSVAGFHRFALDLLAHGAPPALVLAAGRAAAEEVRHTQLCAVLASGYAGRPVGPGPLPIASVEVARSLEELAVWTARDGAVAETLAALLAGAMLERAADPACRRALTVIARDEASHAALAWRSLAWAVSTGGRSVVDAIAPVLLASPESFRDAAGRSELAAHGLLSDVEQRKVREVGLREVIGPAALALIGKSEGRASA
jgi:hypothetical protein